MPASGESQPLGHNLLTFVAHIERSRVPIHLPLLQSHVSIHKRSSPVARLALGRHGRQAHGPSRVHQSRLLDADRVLRANGGGGLPAHQRDALQDPSRVLLPAQRVHQSLSVRTHYKAVQARLLSAARPLRPVHRARFALPHYFLLRAKQQSH